jgi:hypothetical protein
MWNPLGKYRHFFWLGKMSVNPFPDILFSLPVCERGLILEAAISITYIIRPLF